MRTGLPHIPSRSPTASADERVGEAQCRLLDELFLAHDGNLMPSLTPPRLQDALPVFGSHPHHKAVRAMPVSVVRLVRSLHIPPLIARALYPSTQRRVARAQREEGGADRGTRTPKPLRALAPEASVFTNFTRSAGIKKVPDHAVEVKWAGFVGRRGRGWGTLLFRRVPCRQTAAHSGSEICSTFTLFFCGLTS